jgi:phenylalanyl-tRNA synthetase beta chain
MKASLSTMNFINTEYGRGNTDVLAIGIDELKKLATNRLGGLEGVEEYGQRFEGVVVARVISCTKHDNSDRLHVCVIDDGGATSGVDRDDNGYVQVICGAPNVREGLTVAWIPPGATVPSSRATDPFVLSVREIRGKTSNGMLASPSELGLFDSHDGILEIDESEVGKELMKPGTELKQLYSLDDVLLEFENKMFTHRPDCFGQIGLARELFAIQELTYTSPEWYWKKPKFDEAHDVKIDIFNTVSERVPRIMAVAMKNIVVGESPVWLKSFITRMGGKPVNNVVDVSNYIMHLTGQPTHAYDLKKLSGGIIGARMATKGERISLLNGKTIELTEEDIVIADKKTPVGLAGIMGGKDTEVDQNTTDILLEVASFDMYSIRKSAMRHGIFTDAFTRFSKGQSPLQNDRVIAKFMAMLSEITGAYQASTVTDLTSDLTEKMLDQHAVHGLVKTSVDFVNSRLGTELSFDEISEILHRVEMAVIPGEDGYFEVGAPYFRTDIELPEDVVEEVGRLYGFDRLELKLPPRTVKPAPRNMLNDFKDDIRDSLSAAGANEVLSYSFIHGDVLKKAGVAEPEAWCFHIRNALSPDLQYYRPTLLPGLITKVHPNLKSDMVRTDDNEFALFEIGKVHVKNHMDDEGLPSEMERLAFVFASDEKTATKKYSGSALFMAKQYLLPFIRADIEFLPLTTNEYPITSAYDLGRSAQIAISGEVLGVVGEFRSDVKKAFKLPDYCAGYELDLTLLRKYAYSPTYRGIGTFPKTLQDITLVVPKDTSFSDVTAHITSKLKEYALPKDYEFSVLPRDIFSKEGSDSINMTFRIWLWHPEKTLVTQEVNDLLSAIAHSSELTFGQTQKEEGK